MVIEIKRETPQLANIDKLAKIAKEATDRANAAEARVKELEAQLSKSVGRFDRNAYQREYMRDVKFAKAEGLTVYEWRKKHGKH